jgi:hypothetical protein
VPDILAVWVGFFLSVSFSSRRRSRWGRSTERELRDTSGEMGLSLSLTATTESEKAKKTEGKTAKAQEPARKRKQRKKRKREEMNKKASQ